MGELMLERALDAALSSADQAPWRVLSDLLEERGDPRGELMRLQLDLESGVPRGLAKLRLPRVMDTVRSRARALGMVEPVTITRGVVPECRVELWRAKEPDDWWWAAVRRCTIHVPGFDVDRSAWRQTPLAGPRMTWVEQLFGLEREGLELLAGGVERPRLTVVEFAEGTRPDPLPEAGLEALWQQVARQAPALERVQLSNSKPARADFPVTTVVALVEAAARLPVRDVAVELHGREAVAVNTRLRLLQTRPRVTATLQGLMTDWTRPDGGNGLVVKARLDGERIEVSVEAALRARVAEVLGLPLGSSRLAFT